MNFSKMYTFFSFDQGIVYKQRGHKRPRGIKDRSPIIYLLELIEDVKIGISRKCFIALE